MEPSIRKHTETPQFFNNLTGAQIDQHASLLVLNSRGIIQSILLNDSSLCAESAKNILSHSARLIELCKNIDISPSDLKYPIDRSAAISRVVDTLQSENIKSWLNEHCDEETKNKLDSIVKEFTCSSYTPHHNLSAIEPIDPVLLGAKPPKP